MSNEPTAGKGVDPEMLAAYIANRLPPDQRAAVEAQLARDPDSYALMVDTVAALEDDEIKALEVKESPVRMIAFAPNERKPRLRAWVIAGGVFATAAAIVLALWTPDLLSQLRGDGVDPRLEALVEAVGEERYLEARLTGGFRHGPFRGAMRGSVQSNLALLAASSAAEQNATASPQARHTWARAQALMGNHDAAIATLTSLIDGGSDGPSVLTDAAAAYLARAGAGPIEQTRGDLERARELSERALRADAALPEALFNVALSLERLQRVADANHAWNRFLAVERLSGWRAEAAQHLKQLER